MGKAIIYVVFCGVSAVVSGLWYGLGRGEPALFPTLAGALAIGIASPILLRKDFQFVGIPGPVEIVFALGALVASIYAGLKSNEFWFWAVVLLQSIPSIRISLVSLKAYQRPLPLKIAVGVALAALFGLNVFLGVRHSDWVGKTSVALVKEWFPEATAPVVTPEPGKKPAPKPSPPPPAPVKPLEPSGPVAKIDGRPLSIEMVEYQRHIDTVLDAKSGRDDAIAALLQAYTTRAILEKKFKAFNPDDLKDESQWVMNRTRDSRLLHQIRTHKSEELFLDVYVGANGLYKRKLQGIFEKIKQEEFRKRSQEVLQEVQKADGVERPGPKLEGVTKAECRYSFKKREFIGKYEVEENAAAKPDPRDALAAKLAKIGVNTTMAEISWGDMNALIVRRVQDDIKGPVYETYRVVEDGLYPVWFKKQCKDMSIEIPNAELRKAMQELAKDVSHIIR